MDIKFDEALSLSRKAYGLITKSEISPQEQDMVVVDAAKYYTDHLAPGYETYRKCVSTDATVVEWSDHDSYFTDSHGVDYLDCMGGNGVFLCGHKNPEIINAIQHQINRYALCSQDLLDPLRGYLSHLVSLISPGDLQYCFFNNGGAEAIEIALKLARLASEKTYIISTVNGFHGKTMGALSATGKGTYRKPYLPLVPGFQHVEFGNAEAMETAIRNLIAVGETVAAVIVEPIQGEAGIIIPPDDYFPKLREICDKYECFLIDDEIQSGMGRTGTIWAVDRWGVVPDIIVFGKAFGGGVMPTTGIIARPHLWKLVGKPLILGSPTYGGNPLACSASIATIKYILENDVPGQCQVKGDYLMGGLRKLQDRHPYLVDVRGRGLMIGIEYPTDAIGWAVAKGLFKNHILIGGYLNNARVARMEPPVVFTYAEMDRVIETMDRVLGEVELEIPPK